MDLRELAGQIDAIRGVLPFNVAIVFVVAVLAQVVKRADYERHRRDGKPVGHRGGDKHGYLRRLYWWMPFILASLAYLILWLLGGPRLMALPGKVGQGLLDGAVATVLYQFLERLPWVRPLLEKTGGK
jgi:hypothetical protein